ncbi:cytochrome b561 domain-containing protein [Lichenicoccus roseus]|uniref:Cytochrome B n=1 Tax=Lichenicoccus roseus TaxID=2683649 RepID=A0A5R9J5R7_9PROT|nr:cytochrome b561 domain-containing protein [Lichenicoccus roseus]TLU72964.1 cytochrome B [Lichenicoccus roseus]
MRDPFLLHGTLMLIAWLVLLPLGALIARTRKVTPRQDWPRVVENLTWWWLHRLLQWSGVGIALLGLAVAWRATGGLATGLLHVQAGLLVLTLATLQIVSTWFRGDKGGPTGSHADPAQPATWRGDHYDMTPRRRIFEAWHKTVGWGSILLALFTVLLGLQLYGWPRPLVEATVALALLQAGVAFWLIRTARGVNTYQALWGPDPRHPGNRPEA